MSVDARAIVQEFEGARLGDRRLEQRLVATAVALAGSPDSSFPRATRTPAALRGTYRFVNHEHITPDRIISPHREQTRRRAEAAGVMLAIHDTTQLEFNGEDDREGLGFVRSENDQGFSLHCALAVAGDGSRRPLGVLAHRTWVRTERKPKRRRGGETFADANRESLRWIEQVREVEDSIGNLRTIHVMDREADAFPLLQDMTSNDWRFVVRMRQDRAVLDECDERDGHASEAIAFGAWQVSMAVPISKRAARKIPQQQRDARNERVAKLAVKTARIRLKAPIYMPADRREAVDVHVVHAIELGPPDDDPVSWVLLTNEPVATAEQALAVLEIYRTRWLIEEFFKALKTGCAIEKRQLESYDGLANALALFLPIAWQLLLLRNLHRTEASAPAARVLTPTQIDVLRAQLPKLVPPQPTVDDVLRAVAYLGGHYVKQPPGWQSLGHGMERLLDLERGWLLAKHSPASCG